MSTATPWTEDRVQTLTRLWRDGQSASQIARTLAGGVTRNAVVGKVHRLGLSGRPKPTAPGARPPRARRPGRRTRRVAFSPTPVIVVASALAPPAVGMASMRSV